MDINIDFNHIADLYDYYVNVDFDIPFYKSLCEKCNGNVLELMCGTGRVSIPLAEHGVKLTCVDYSKEMLDVFKRKIPANSFNAELTLICQDICELDIKKSFDLVFIPFNSITEIVDKEKRRQAIKKTYEHLSESGYFFVTLYNPVYRLKTADGNMRCIGSFNMGGSRKLVVSYYNLYDKQKNMIHGTQFYETYNENNKLIEKRILDISFSLVSKEEMIEMSVGSGFTLKNIYGDYNYGEFNENSQFMNFLFTKESGQVKI